MRVQKDYFDTHGSIYPINFTFYTQGASITTRDALLLILARC